MAKRNQTGFTVRAESPDEQKLWDRVSKAEGFRSVSAWMAEQARKRAQEMEQVLQFGDYLTIQGRKIPFSEVPGADQHECRLVNAIEICQQPSLAKEEVRRAAEMLFSVLRAGSDTQKARARQVRENNAAVDGAIELMELAMGH